MIAPDHRFWRFASVAVALTLAGAIAWYRLGVTGVNPGWVFIELLPLAVTLPLMLGGKRKGTVVSMLVGMLYTVNASFIATSVDGRLLGVVAIVATVALFGTLFMLGKRQLADERAENP